MKFIAYTTKGLEKVAAQEIQDTLDQVVVEKIDTKRIIFHTESNFEKLTQLKTVDDIGFLVTEVEKFENTEQLANLDFNKFRDLLKEFKKLNHAFSLTTSIAKSDIDPKSLIQSLSEFISKKYNWTFSEFDHTNFDIRVFIDQSHCEVSIRLTTQPLQNRLYKTLSKLGSLKPPIAAAMLQLATNNQTSSKIVDDFCGSGTVLCEAYLSGHQIYGGDIDPNSVLTTQTNLKNLKFKLLNNIQSLDATKTNWPGNYFDAAISNLPWDKQIKIDSITYLYIGTLKEYSRILKPTGTLCLLVSKPELLIKHTKSFFPNSTIKEIKIGYLGQNPSIVVIKPKSGFD